MARILQFAALPALGLVLAACTVAGAQSAQRSYLPLVHRSGTGGVAATVTPAGVVGCGVPRRDVRTLSDAAASQVAPQLVRRTVRELRGVAPGDVTADSARLLRAERSTFVLDVAVLEIAPGPGGALVLTLADPDDPTQTIVAELPDQSCGAAARQADLSTARAGALAACQVAPPSAPRRLYGGATVAGVGFFDPDPSRPGAAPNGLGLGPLLSLTSTDCNPFAAPSPTATRTPTASPAPGAATPTPTPVANAPTPPGPSPSATVTSRPPTATPVPPTATPTPSIIVREGRDRTASAEFTLRAGSATVDTLYTGSGIFHAYFYDQTTSLTTLIVSRDYLTAGGVHAEHVPVTGLAAGRYVVRVSSADGPWQFTISQP